MFKLQEGQVYGNKELAQWFGIKEGSFKNQKEKKLEQLSRFAEYRLVGNKTKKVLITKVYDTGIYTKAGSKNYEIIKNNIDKIWSQDGLDSCRRVSEVMVKDQLVPLAPSSVYNYTRKGRNQLYGKPFSGGGSLGSCIYIWCKKEGDKLVLLTPEEERIKSNVIKKYFGDATEKQVIVQGMVETGEITKEEAWDVLTELTDMKGANFTSFLRELELKLGCRVIKGTLVDRRESAFELTEEK